ncbi:MAG: sialidase family protein [Chloroflexales bacterium]
MAKAGIVYVGTDNGLVTYSDPGATGQWRRVGHALEGREVRAIIAADSPDEHGSLVVIVGLSSGDALISNDGGQSWGAASSAEADTLSALRASTRPRIATSQGVAQWMGAHPPAPGANALAMLAGKQETLLAAIADGTTLVRSENNGATWQQSTFSRPLQGAITVLAPSSYHMDICWAGSDAGQILRSDDRGCTWGEIARVPDAIRALAVLRLI